MIAIPAMGAFLILCIAILATAVTAVDLPSDFTDDRFWIRKRFFNPLSPESIEQVRLRVDEICDDCKETHREGVQLMLKHMFEKGGEQYVSTSAGPVPLYSLKFSQKCANRLARFVPLHVLMDPYTAILADFQDPDGVSIALKLFRNNDHKNLLRLLVIHDINLKATDRNGVSLWDECCRLNPGIIQEFHSRHEGWADKINRLREYDRFWMNEWIRHRTIRDEMANLASGDEILAKDGDTTSIGNVAGGDITGWINRHARSGQLFPSSSDDDQYDVLTDIAENHYKVDTNKPGEDGKTCLEFACRNHNAEIVLALLKFQDIDVNRIDNDGDTPLLATFKSFLKLQEAADGKKERMYEVIQLLLDDERVDATIADADGNTLFSLANQNGINQITAMLPAQKEKVVNMIRKNFDVNTIIEGRSYLHHSCDRLSHKSVVALLQYDDIKVNEKDERNGDTPLLITLKSYLSQMSHISEGRRRMMAIVMALLSDQRIRENIADNNGNTLLHLACAKGVLEIVERLLSRDDPAINIVNAAGETPFSLAFRGLQHGPTGHATIEERAMVAAALLKADGATHGDASLIAIFKSYLTASTHLSDGRELMVKTIKSCIVDERINENAFDDEGNTILHLACANGVYEIVEMFIGREGSSSSAINHVDLAGQTPSSIGFQFHDHGPTSPFVNNCRVATVIALLNLKGVDPNAKNLNGDTPLLAMFKSYLMVQTNEGDESYRIFKLIQALFIHGPADENIPDNQGNTLLHLACANGNSEIVEMLQNQKVSAINTANNAGETPLFLGCQYRSASDHPGRQKRTRGMSVANSQHRLSVVKALLLFPHVDVNQRNANGDTPLLFLFKSYLPFSRRPGHRRDHFYKMMQLLLGNNRVEVDAVDNDGNSLLLLAAANGDCSLVDDLRKRDDVNIKRQNLAGQTAVSLLTANDQCSSDLGEQPLRMQLLFWMLLDTVGSAINSKIPGYPQPTTLLHLAAAESDAVTIRALLHLKEVKDADGVKFDEIKVNEKDDNGNTPLIASYQAYLKKKVKNIETIMLINAKVKALPVEERVQVDVADKNWKSLLELDGDNGDDKIVGILLESHDPPFPNVIAAVDIGNEPDTPPHPLYEAFLKTKTKMIKERNRIKEVIEALLEDNRVQDNTVDKNGNTLLHLACAEEDVDIVSLWLQRRRVVEPSDVLAVNIVNGAGQTPFSIAFMAAYLTDDTHGSTRKMTEIVQLFADYEPTDLTIEVFDPIRQNTATLSRIARRRSKKEAGDVLKAFRLYKSPHRHRRWLSLLSPSDRKRVRTQSMSSPARDSPMSPSSEYSSSPFSSAKKSPLEKFTSSVKRSFTFSKSRQSTENFDG